MLLKGSFTTSHQDPKSSLYRMNQQMAKKNGNCNSPFLKARIWQFQGQRGFSLMEVLVAVVLLGIVYATLFGLMSTSLKNVSRIEEREKIVRFGQMKLNELVVRAKRGEAGRVLSG